MKADKNGFSVITVVLLIFATVATLVLAIRLFIDQDKQYYRGENIANHPLFKQMLSHPWFRDADGLPLNHNYSSAQGWRPVSYEDVFVVPSTTRVMAIDMLKDHPVVKLALTDAQKLLGGMESDEEWEELCAATEGNPGMRTLIANPNPLIVHPDCSSYLVRFVVIVPPRLAQPSVGLRDDALLIRFSMLPSRYFTKLRELPLIVVLPSTPTQVYNSCIWTSDKDHSCENP